MPNRIWSDEKNDWIIVDDATNQAINVEVLDGKGYYRNPKLDEEVISNQYIQDLYRFYKLNPKRGDFLDIFNLSLNFYSLKTLQYLQKILLLYSISSVYYPDLKVVIDP